MDELDLALVNALQHDPRAPWARLARPLGVDAATLSRRWARLSASGEAWVTSSAGPSQLDYGAFALVEVGCLPGANERIAAEVATDPCAGSVEHTTGNRDLLLTVSAMSVAAVSEYVLDRLGRIDGVTFTRTHLSHRLHREASRWRLDSLSQDQRRDLERGAAAGGGHEPGPLRDDEVAVLLALAPDGRRSHAALAAGLGLPEARVRRALTGMLSTGRAVLRCEAAHWLAGWRVTGMLWLNVPPPRLRAVADAIATMREARMVCSVVGSANLMVNVWVHGMRELAAFQARLASLYPEIQIVEQSVTLKWVKRVGRLLDGKGRSIGCIPLDPRKTSPAVLGRPPG
ncbi:Lrp/AsnC family transcriptional regulator [Actinomadura napierensis]|uniref:Lrp/AsnC family transcriptional regulator n=1 Tax=Actinomadura napierensis TaxID=267854 RepID=A0ABN3A6N1_9ACTN